MNSMEVTLLNGDVVVLRESWNCCNGVMDCGSSVDVYNLEGEFMCSIPNLRLPDEDDEVTIEHLFDVLEREVC